MFNSGLFSVILNSLPGRVREVDNGHAGGHRTSSTGAQSQPTLLSDGATTYSVMGQKRAEETIEGGLYHWGGINIADHLLHHQALQINPGSARIFQYIQDK